MGFLEDIQQCVHHSARVDGLKKNHLVEEVTETRVKIQSDGQYLLYDFEKIRGLFPFFEDVKGLKTIADNVIFTIDGKGNHWVFVIELKTGKISPLGQIYATKLFVDYLIKSINRVCGSAYTPLVRGLGYSKQHRPPTNLKNIYDKSNNAYFTGNLFNLTFYRV